MSDFLVTEKDSVSCVQVTALGETIRLMAELDGVIDVNGGWPVR